MGGESHNALMSRALLSPNYCSCVPTRRLADRPDDVALYAEQFFTNPELAHSLGYQGWSRPVTPSLEGEEGEGSLSGGGSGGSPGGGGDFEEEGELAGTTEMDVLELEKLLISLFNEADTDASGALDHAEFQQLMATADLGLSKAEVKVLIAEVDEDADGKITYQEFVPIAVETIQTMRLKARFAERELDITDDIRYAAESIVGMSASEFGAFVRAASDKLNTGGIFSRQQLKALLKSKALGLSKNQATAAAADVTFDMDGTVSVGSLEESLYGVVIRVVCDALAMQDLGEVGELLVQIFEHYDTESSGFLDRKVAKTAVLQVFEFVTRLQAAALFSDAPTDEEGKIAWKEFLPKLTTLVKAMGDPEAIREKSEMAMRSEFAPVELMSHVDRAKFDTTVEQLFKEADIDGNGMLDVHEFRRCMQGMGDLGLTNHEVNFLMEHFDTDGDAMISLEEFNNLAYDQLAQLSRERAIMTALNEADSM